MGKPQFVWNGNDLDNGTSRFIDRPFSITEDATGLLTVVVDFVIEADSAEALQTLYNSTVDDFRGQNKDFSVTLDDAASNKLRDIVAFSSTGLQTGCAVSIDQTRTFSKHGMGLTIIAATVAPTPTGGGGSSFENASLKTVTTYDAGRVAQIQVTGPFYPTDALTALAAYTAAREEILTTLLLVDSDGSRNDSSGLSLISEVVENEDGDGGAVSVMLASEWQEPTFSDISGARRVSLHVRRSNAENWQKISESLLNTSKKPTFLSVAAEVTFSRDVVATPEALKAKAAAVRAKVLGIAGTTGDGASASIFLRYEETFNYSSNKIVVAAVIQSNSKILEFRLSTSILRRYNYVTWKRGDGHYAQAPEAPSDAVVTVTIHLKTGTALTEEDFRDIAENVAPVDGGFTYITSSQQLLEEPNISGEYGEGYTIQDFSVSWGRFLLKGSTFANSNKSVFLDPQEK